VRAGECVVVYPEGTLRRDPDLWPMTGKSGAARIGAVRQQQLNQAEPIYRAKPLMPARVPLGGPNRLYRGDAGQSTGLSLNSQD
jgi:1-acyl-sn-glycerol-3-phosphate acyltransferase